MTKVEELLERVEAHITCEKGHDWLHEMLLTLVAVATEEGCDDGWAASKTLWTRMQKWNDEWREENPKERSLTLLDAIDLIEWKIAAAEAQGEAKGRAEGAEQERREILNPLVDKHWNSKEDQLREGIIGDLAQLEFLKGKHPEMTWEELRCKYGNPVVDSLIAAARVRGAEAERERIWAERGRIGGEHGNWVNIPESAFRRPLLAPATKEEGT